MRGIHTNTPEVNFVKKSLCILYWTKLWLFTTWWMWFYRTTQALNKYTIRSQTYVMTYFLHEREKEKLIFVEKEGTEVI